MSIEMATTMMLSTNEERGHSRFLSPSQSLALYLRSQSSIHWYHDMASSLLLSLSLSARVWAQRKKRREAEPGKESFSLRRKNKKK